MKCLYLSAKRYSFNKSVIKGFTENNIDVITLDYEELFNPVINGFIKRFESLPNRIKDLWKSNYVKEINKKYIRIFNLNQPDLVFIYNNQNILPSTIEYFKNSAKIIFLLGDNPLYTPTSPYNLPILFYADYILCPDTFWIEQLTVMGVRNIHFECFASDPDLYFPFTPSEDIYNIHKSDIVYIGMAQKNNWGYKRFKFLDQFKSFDLKAFLGGDGYKRRWKNQFPDLESKIIEYNHFDPFFNNTVYNCSKISPVEVVPSIFNGIHARVFDILGAGIFPLCEYSRDLSEVFKNIPVSYIKNFDEAEDIVRYLLKHNDERSGLINQMQAVVMNRFASKKVISRMLNYLKG